MLQDTPVPTGDTEMAKAPTLNLEDMTGAQLQDLIYKAQQLRTEKKAQTIQDLRIKIQDMCEEEGVELSEVYPPPSPTRGRKPTESGRAPARMKYRSLKDPSLQSAGKGRPAKWLIEEMAETGKPMEAFLIDPRESK